MYKYVLILGSSHFLAENYINKAIARISSHQKIDFLARSQLYLSPGLAVKRNALFTNCSVVIKTFLNPECLLRELRSIETALGRIRPYKNSPRTIDIDIFFSNKIKFSNFLLSIPHVDGFNREFFVTPARQAIINLKKPDNNLSGQLHR